MTGVAGPNAGVIVMVWPTIPRTFRRIILANAGWCNSSMTNSVSPSVSIATDDARTRIVDATVNAVLFRDILKPLAAGLGPLGETAVDAVADRVFGPAPER